MMDRLTPEMIRVIQYEQERRASYIQLENAAKAARKQADKSEKLTTLAKVLGYLSLNMRTSSQR
jgi:hypothetical protein